MHGQNHIKFVTVTFTWNDNWSLFNFRRSH